MVVRTYNIELNMSEEAKAYWLSLLVVCRDAYNACANRIEANQPVLSMVPVHNLCYDYLRSEFPSLPSQGVIRIQKEVTKAFKAIRKNKHKDANTPQRKSLSLTLDKRLYSKLTDKGIYLPNGRPMKREFCSFNLYPQVIEFFSKYQAKDPTIFYRDGQFYLAVPFEVPGLPCSNDSSIGVDLGVKRLFVTSEGYSFVDKKYLAERRKVRYLKRSLKEKGTHSAKRHLAKVKRREHHLSKDMVERASNALLRSTKASYLILEDLSKIKQKTAKTEDGFKRKRHNSMLSQVPFYKFKERLTAKAPLFGKKVETVSPAFTSQTDSRTNKRDGVRKGCRYYCSDGAVLDADHNAAVNIALRKDHLVSSVLPIDGGLKPLTSRVSSTTRTSSSTRQAYRL